MFVVRIDIDDERTDHKVFSRKVDAEARFRSAAIMTWDDEIKGTALFQVIGIDDARQAEMAVKGGKSDSVLLLDKEPRTLDFDIDLSDLEI